MDVVVVLDVLVFVVLLNMQIIKDGFGTGHQTCGYCLKATQLGQGTLFVWNKLGDCVLKIRCLICRSLISYHNSSWTCAATHIQSHNIVTAQDIAATTALASESEANGEAFPIHKLPFPPPVKKEAPGDATLMRHTFVAPSYKTDTQPYHRIKRTIAKWIAADYLPYRIVDTTVFRAMARNLDPKCPDFGGKAITSQVGHYHEYCSVLPAFLNIFFLSL